MAKFKNTDKIVFRDLGDGEFIITVKQVRLAYEHVFETWAKNDGEKKKYSGKFIMPEATHSKEIEILQTFLEGLKTDYFKGAKLKADALFFKDGDNEGKEEFEDAWFISASETEKNPPAVIDRDKTPLKASDDKVYSGAYVNVQIKPWKQDNAYGKKINANLVAVQFFKKGEKFGGAGAVSKQVIDDGFDEYEEEDISDDGFSDD